jgi:hypothetical protein
MRVREMAQLREPGPCYSLDLECLLKVHVWKFRSLACGAMVRQWNL